MSNTIYAAFNDPHQAEKAAGALLDHGLRAEDLSVVRHHGASTELHEIVNPRTGEVRHENAVDDDIESTAEKGITTTTAKDAGAGAITGTAWGAGLGALAAIASLIVPGFGLVVGGGALAAALGGVAAGAGAGAVAGAVTGFLKDQGVDEDAAGHYERTVGEGGALLAVALPSNDVDETAAREILAKYGAGNVNAYASRGYVA
jgi:uncharacterized membrane protein